jgi:hypothetical protein
MLLIIPAETSRILESVDAARQPISEWELADAISNILKADKLPQDERKGAWAEWAAFFFRPFYDEESRPWDTHFGPTMTAIDAVGQPVYIPDLAQVDADTITYWEPAPPPPRTRLCAHDTRRVDFLEAKV